MSHGLGPDVTRGKDAGHGGSHVMVRDDMTLLVKDAEALRQKLGRGLSAHSDKDAAALVPIVERLNLVGPEIPERDGLYGMGTVYGLYDGLEPHRDLGLFQDLPLANPAGGKMGLSDHHCHGSRHPR